jgi:flagellar biosynthesis/type III secretory pathway M-ring protein FliF/YscJ
MKSQKRMNFWALLRWLFVAVILVTGVFAFVKQMRGQEMKANLSLSKDEQRDLTDIAKDQQILDLRRQLLQQEVQSLSTQIQAESQKLQGERDMLTKKLAEAHGLDVKKYRLDEKAGAFVLISDPAKTERPSVSVPHISARKP